MTGLCLPSVAYKSKFCDYHFESGLNPGMSLLAQIMHIHVNTREKNTP